MKLVPFTKKLQAQMGITKTKKGFMIDRERLVDQKKYQSKEVIPAPKKSSAKNSTKEVKSKPKEENKDERIGLY